MKFVANVRNTEKVVVELQSIGERVVDNARKLMHASSKKIVDRAKLMAPVDDHQLEKSIHLERSVGERGRLVLTVTAGGVVDGVNVDDYATLIHENYESMDPGEGTLQKRAANPGVYIGEKFLTRAAEEEEDKLATRMIAAIRRITQK